MSTRFTVQRTLASVLATLVFWTPLSVTVARAQDLVESAPAPAEAERGPLSESIPLDALRVDPGASEEVDTSALRDGLTLDRDVVEDSNAAGGESSEVDEVSDPETNQSKEPAVAQNLPTGPSKTAVTPQQISLPKGEGSIEGMGESFTPNLSSGTGTFSVPIALPKGRAGVQPSLALSYATSGGNGIVGIGWSLAMPFISRQTDKGLPRYVDQAAWHAQEDVFMYNGGQELVPIDSAAATRMEGAPVPQELSDWQQYRARVEGGFMRFFRSPDSRRWVVQSKDGTRFEFGHCSSNSSSVGTCTGPAVQADPEDSSLIFSWQLVRMSDVHGSTVHYAYTQNAGVLYPESLYYTSPASCAAEDINLARNCSAPLSDYAYRVRFVYEARKDVTSSYLTTWRTEQALRLKRIEVTGADVAVGSRFLVRRYHLSYDTEAYHSLLSQVQVEGRPSSFDHRLELTLGNALVPEASLGASFVGELLPPMRFSYTAPSVTTDTIPGFGGLDTTVHESQASPDHSVDEGRVDLFDVNSDGLPDLLVTDPARHKGGMGVYFNGFPNGKPGRAGDFSDGVRVDIAADLSGTLSLSNPNIVPMDVDGDARVDVLHVPRKANYGYFVLSKVPTPQGMAYAPLEDWSFSHVSDLLPLGETDPRIDLGTDGLAVKTLDVNNDGLIDIVRTTGSLMETWLNLGRYPEGDGRFGQASWAGGRWELSTLPVPSCLPFAGRSLDFGDRNIRIADMNGDGLQDIVKVAPDEMVWWPGRGEGAFGQGSHACDQSSSSGRELRMEHPPRELSTELAGLELMDVNHDGAADLVQVGANHLSVWFNESGAALTDRIIVEGTPFAGGIERVRVADIDGSSTADLIFADAKHYRWIDPMGGVKPRLLSQVDNGLGALTTLSYSSSAIDYLRDLSEATRCDPAALDCFTWQREPVLQGQRAGDCDQKVLANNGECVHRAGGSQVISTVVRKVSTTDRLDALGVEASVSETEYRYHDGYYEGIEQEFRGFGAADAVAIGDEYEPASYTRTYFHQGRRPNEISADRLADNPNEALKGREFLTEIWNEAGVYLKTSHATYAVRKLLSGLNGVGVSYAYVKSSDEYRYDTTRTAGSKAPTLQLVSVLRERAEAGLETVSAAPAQSGDAKHPIKVRDLAYAHVRTSIDRVDNVGNLLEQTAWGRDGRGEYSELVADESIVQHSVPTRVTDFLCGNSNWLWRTAESWVSASGSTEKLGYSTTRYNRCGDVVSARRTATLPSVGGFNFAGDGTAQGYAQTGTQEISSSQIDLWGQATTQCAGAELEGGADGCLRLGSVTYDPSYQQLVLQESIATDAEGGSVHYLSSQAAWDRGLGVLRNAIDPNGKASEVFYDGLGRLTGIVAPPVVGCEGTRIPSTRITYQLTNAPASQPLSRVSTTTLLSCANYSLADSQIVAYAYVDGLGRPRAALAEGETDGAAFDDGRPHPFVLSGRQIFDKKGQPRLSYQPMFYDGSPDDYASVIRRPNTPYKRALFDAFGRPTLSINEDGSYSSISYHALSTDVCDEVDNGFGADGMESYVGTCTTERTDGHGRGIDQQLRQVTLTGAREHHRLFTYYRADGAVLRVIRALTPDNILRPETGTAGLTSYVERRFYYDSLGRRIASEDPDTDNRQDGNLATRTWRYLFNPVGDLAAVRDPRGCGQNFYYDLAGRLIGETYVGCTEAQLGEVASLDVPAGSVGMGRVSGPVAVHTRSVFDKYPENADWVNAQGVDGVKGRLTSVEDRGQRTSFSYDHRGQVTGVSKQLAVIADESTLATGLDGSGRPRNDGANETGVSPSSVMFGPGYDRHDMSTTYDHAGRVVTTTYPRDGNLEPVNTYVRGRLSYYRNGAPKRAELLIGSAVYPVVESISYTRDGLPAVTRYGDGLFTGRKATESRTLYDARRRPVQMFTSRTPAAGREPQTLGAVSTVNYQRLNWDGASNLFLVEDRRIPEEWPAGHKPVDQRVTHDALYRVGAVSHLYRTASSLDTATDWRTEEARHRAADPMHATAAPMIAAQAPNRVVDLEYSHDWLANMTEWTDDAHVFYERSIGKIANGTQLSPNQPSPAYRPSALYMTSDLAPKPSGLLGGWLEADYGASGNMVGMTAHARCSHVTVATQTSPGTCVDPGGSNLSDRRSALRNGCDCDSEQHYVYRYDELNRLHEARRYDRGTEGGDWALVARQRYRYDGANQRTVKQTFDVVSGDHRAALTVFPGEFEERGLLVRSDGLGWERSDETERQYLVAGARLVWKDAGALRAGPNPDYRTTTPPEEGRTRWYRADRCYVNATTQGTICPDYHGGPQLENAAGAPATQPTIVATGLGGQSALKFTADSSMLVAPANAQTPVSNQFVVAFAAQIDSAVTQYPLWAHDTYRSGNKRDRIILYAEFAGNNGTLYYYSVEDYGGTNERYQTALSAPIQRGQPFVAVIRSSAAVGAEPAQTELYVNGTRGSSGPQSLATQMSAGVRAKGGSIGELVMYRQALSKTSELPSLHRYLGNRYGITMANTPAENVGAPGLDPKHRITFAITNLIQSTSAVVDLVSGELVEAGGFYPNGAREEWLGASDQVFGAQIPLEHVGFTGKEADEEVGLTYFGERYLVQRIGRWSTPDPLAVHAMGGGEVGNSYHYVSGNLLQARDPLGLDATPAAADRKDQARVDAHEPDRAEGRAEADRVFKSYEDAETANQRVDQYLSNTGSALVIAALDGQLPGGTKGQDVRFDPETRRYTASYTEPNLSGKYSVEAYQQRMKQNILQAQQEDAAFAKTQLCFMLAQALLVVRSGVQFPAPAPTKAPATQVQLPSTKPAQAPAPSIRDAKNLIDSSEGRAGPGTNVGHTRDHVPASGADPIELSAGRAKSLTTVYRNERHALQDLRAILQKSARDIAALPANGGANGSAVAGTFDLAKARQGFHTVRNDTYSVTQRVEFSKVTIRIVRMPDGRLHLLHFSPKVE